MFLMDEDDIKFILMGLKWMTMRGVREDGVYFKLNSKQYLKLNLFGDWFVRVQITNREFVNLDEMDDDDFMGVGYSKEDYLSHPYNTSNPSPMRVKYEFEIVEINENKIRELFNGF